MSGNGDVDQSSLKLNDGKLKPEEGAGTTQLDPQILRGELGQVFGPYVRPLEPIVPNDRLAGLTDRGGSNLLVGEPSFAERKQANKKFDERVDGDSSLNIDQKKDVKDAGKALLDGNYHDFYQAMRSNPNPEERKKILDGLNKNLEGTGMQVHEDADGNFIVSQQGNDRGVRIGHDGKASVVRIEHNQDGPTVSGEVLGGDARRVMKDIGNTATRNILTGDAGNVLKPIRDYAEKMLPKISFA